MSLPSRYVSARDILDGQRSSGSKVNVVGLVMDIMAPISTRGSDWKCEVHLYDKSLEDDTDFLTLNIFRPKESMPDIRCGDVMAISSANVQSRYGFSLLTNYTTVLHIYEAAKIPNPPEDALIALRPSIKQAARVPTPAEAGFVSTFYHTINRDRLPTKATFKTLMTESVNINDKFCELKDVNDGKFVDILVEIVREPYDDGEKSCLWVSDYTENSLFFNLAFTGEGATGGQVGDPYGYTNKDSRPFGKRCMQITCFEPHATFMREKELSIGSWIYMRNVQIKYGHNGSNIEGFLREDRRASGTKISIEPLDVSEGSTSISPRLKEAIRRKRFYQKEKKNQLREITEAAKSRQKRKAQAEPDAERKAGKTNSKQKRKQERDKKFNRAAPEPPQPTVNHQVRCENAHKAASSLSQLAQPITYETMIDDEPVKLQLPFINANYRIVARVLDFHPSQLEHFSRRVKDTDIDHLSDNNPDSDSDSDASVSSKNTNTKWEWHFHLQLEDASLPNDQSKTSIWLLVNNQAAQCLLGLDANDLTRDTDLCAALRQRLSILWGDPVDRKVRFAETMRADQPPSHTPEGNQAPVASQLPFSCCVRQYGVMVPERDASLADAGEGRRWRRVFGLFGTKIAPD
ncbi:hypothetical protein CDD80_6344 [Ophiocordyceps camponoti-rufipedis]|uniref:Protection of telomeres protein 1 n=1 Tax=Ophiocordyceps camponoti-rufipedis TaxID=2004952 RepID=A0A2C5YR01_9HYPO|nr:hypothetical protein CDD80_6344 [Ophiocordyceps camponoti-rufipedis]